MVLLDVIDITKYSTFYKTLRVTSLVIHFIARLREKTKSSTVTAVDMKHALIVLLQSVQQFKDEAKGKQPAIIHQLGLYLDDDGLPTMSRKTTIRTTTTKHQVSNIDTEGESLVNPNR